MPSSEQRFLEGRFNSLRIALMTGFMLLSFLTKASLFTLNGTAADYGTGEYLLTPAQRSKVGSIWFNEKVSLNNSFEMNFELYFGTSDGGADGMAFCLQPVSTSIGVLGGGLGIQGVQPSFFAEFDTYRNGGDPSYDHLAIQMNGNVNNASSSNLAAPVRIKDGVNNVEDGQWHPMRIKWDANTKTFEVYVDCNLRISYTGDIVNNIFSGDDLVYWGFTAATGGRNNEHKVRNISTTLIDIQDESICSGASVGIEIPNTGSVFSWNTTTGVDNATSLTPNLSPSATTEYILTYSGFCGTEVKDTFEIAVEGTELNLGNDTSICDNANLDLTASGGGGYLWSTGASGSTINVSQAGNYSVTVTTPGGCVVTDDINITTQDCTPCTDTDGDGVCDADDLDDDNDGILDEVECPSTLVSTPFNTSGGNSATFTMPSADGGFRFDIDYLDNSFNLEINGQKLVPQEIQCQNSAWRTGQSKLVFSSDLSEFGVAGNSNIWQINGSPGSPVIRVVIGGDGRVSFFGKRTTASQLEAMNIRAGHAQPNPINWNAIGTNEVKMTMIAFGATSISGSGSGVQSCTTDTDGDGIPNYLDTDSDGDGCPDAVEGGAGFALTDLNGQALSGAVDANGVPVIAGSTGQTVATSANANVVAQVCDLELIDPDTLYVCQGDTVSVSAKRLQNGVWFGSESFEQISDSVIKASPTNSGWYGVGVQAGTVKGTNLIVNGDFENGGTGFTSEYVEDCFASPWMQRGGYCVSTDPKAQNPYWSECGDHTTGSGNMFITDASTTQGVKIWCQTINVEENADYEFSAWIQSVMSPNPAILEFQINGVLLGSTLNASSSTCQWQNYAAQWNSGLSTSAEICLVNQNTAGGGNDFALDDIYFGKVTTALSDESDSVWVEVKSSPSIDLGVDTLICQENQMVLTATGGGTYLWNDQSTGATINVTSAGLYSVEVTGDNGCVNSDTINISTQPCAETLCGGNIDFNSWSQAGIDSEGNWVVSDDGRSVNQTINGEPTFYVGNRDYLNVNFTGQMRTDYGRDDDWMGMVFGYENPAIQDSYPITLKTYVFAWKQRNQNGWQEGFSLFEVNGTFNNSSELRSAFTNPYTGSNLLASNFGAGTGYQTSTDHMINIDYTASNITVSVDGSQIFNVDGCFDPGRIGFYNWSQPNVTYSNFTYQFIGNIDMEDDTLCIGEPLNMAVYEGPSCNSSNHYPEGAIFQWDLKDGNTSSENVVNHIYADTGVYNVSLIVSDSLGCADTTTRTVHVAAYPVVDLGADTTICADFDIALDAGNTGSDHHWNTNAVSQEITVDSQGDYSVNVTNWALCSSADTINILVDAGPSVDLGADQNICEGDSILIDASNPGTTYAWNNGASSQIITAKTTGTFGLVVTNSNGCIDSDSMNLLVNELPIVDLGADKIICDRDSVVLDARNIGLNYSWNTGETTQTLAVLRTGIYGVEVRDEIGCLGSDSMTLIVNPLPAVDLGVDSNICAGEGVYLDAGNPGKSYSWSTGEFSQTIDITETGTYYVTVSDDIGCSGADTMELLVNELPVVNLGADQRICRGDEVGVDAGNAGLNFVWNTGATSQTLGINDPGIYGVEVRDDIGCLGSDSMVLHVNELPVVDLGPDTVICTWESFVFNAENPGLNYNWSDGSSSQTIEVTGEGNYSVTVSDSINCSGSDEVYLAVDHVPNPFRVQESDFCEGDTILLSPASYPADDQFLWMESGNTSDSLFVNAAGTYNGLVLSYHCQDTFAYHVNQLDTPDVEIMDISGAEHYCFDYETAKLELQGDDADIVDVTWLSTDEMGYVYRAKSEGSHYALADDGFCQSLVKYDLEEHCELQVYIPNAFTPDGNTVNDTWRPLSRYVENYSLTVLSRWGTVVFESNDPFESWDGTGKTGQRCPIDVYVYKVKFGFATEHGGNGEKNITGTVTLVR